MISLTKKSFPVLLDFLSALLRQLVLLMATLSGIALFAMLLVTCADLVLRNFGHPLPGAYDLVKLAGGMVVACALPYTTAVKGHVAVEFFYHRLGRIGRVVTDTAIRMIIMALFGLLSWHLALYGINLKQAGQVSMTISLPVFWLPFVMSFACAVSALVTFYHLLHPGRSLLKS